MTQTRAAVVTETSVIDRILMPLINHQTTVRCVITSGRDDGSTFELVCFFSTTCNVYDDRDDVPFEH